MVELVDYEHKSLVGKKLKDKAGRYYTYTGLRVSKRGGNGKFYLMAERMNYGRYIMLINNIDVPEGAIIHHKNGDKSDFSLDNLVVLSKSEYVKLRRSKNN